MAGVDPSFGKSRTYTIVKASLPKKKQWPKALEQQGSGTCISLSLQYMGLFSVLVKSQLIRKDPDAGKD